MNTPASETMSPAEQAIVAAMAERVRQLRSRRGIPNGVSLEEAIALHFVGADEVEQARWSDDRLLLQGAESGRVAPAVVVLPVSNTFGAVVGPVALAESPRAFSGSGRRAQASQW
jgi:hypothetical protein